MKKATKCFFYAMGSILDLSPSKNYNQNPEADQEAIRNDWESVGDYLRESIDQYGQKKETKSSAARYLNQTC